MADINEEAYFDISPTLNEDVGRVMFERTDVSSWEDNARLFKKAFNWSSAMTDDEKGRIDFFAANAGILDQESMYAHFDLEAEPAKPNLATIEVDLLSSLYGLKLFIHYTRKTRAQLPASALFTPAMIITASSVALYQFPTGPQYCAAKYGLVGLTRSVGPKLLAEDNLTVNAILPGLVATALPSAWVLKQCHPEYITPMSLIIEAFDELMKEEIMDGKLTRKTGQCVEVSEDKLHYRKPVEYSSEGARWLLDGDMEGGFVTSGPPTDAKDQ